MPTPSRLSFIALAAVLLFLPQAHAQAERAKEVIELPVEQLGNFEIQDLMVRVEYADGRRGRPATITVTPQGDMLKYETLVLGAQTERGMRTILLTRTEDGGFTGRGMLPAPRQTTSLGLYLDERATNGFNIGMPPSVDGRFEGSQETNGIKIDVTIDTDPPVIVIVVKF